jgi:UDP-glucose/iron transport system permease protein
MNIISLTAQDLGLAAVLVLLLAGLSMQMKLGLERSLLIAASRTVIQLLLIGLVLKAIFTNVHPGWMALISLIMLTVAGREVMVRQSRRFRGYWGFGLGTSSMFVSTFTVTLISLTVVINADPWYAPQYAIPLLGMMFGNTMNGIALGLDRLTQITWQNRSVIEARLLLGQSWRLAISSIHRDSIRAGLIPIINTMAVAGIVSLPGMMTGQILAGAQPVDAVKYQILIMFMIAAGTGFGTVVAVTFGARRLFDDRERLRLDRLIKNGD